MNTASLPTLITFPRTTSPTFGRFVRGLSFSLAANIAAKSSSSLLMVLTSRARARSRSGEATRRRPRCQRPSGRFHVPEHPLDDRVTAAPLRQRLHPGLEIRISLTVGLQPLGRDAQ